MNRSLVRRRFTAQIPPASTGAGETGSAASEAYTRAAHTSYFAMARSGGYAKPSIPRRTAASRLTLAAKSSPATVRNRKQPGFSSGVEPDHGLHGFSPRMEFLFPIGGRHLRLESRRGGNDRAQFLLVGQFASHRREERRAQRRRFRLRGARPDDRACRPGTAGTSHSPTCRRPPSGRRRITPGGGATPMSFSAASIKSATWKATPSSAARPKSAAVVASVRRSPRASGNPVRRAQSDKPRHEQHRLGRV